MRQTSRFAALVLLSSLSLASEAGTFRAYLSVNGNDANPCSLSAPCRLTDAALTAVNDGGEIWFMDSGNFNLGTLNITKSVSIVAVPGAIASIFSINGPAVTIATAGVKVSLKNLVIKSLAGAGSTIGVNILNGTSVSIENCTISDMPGQGIYVNANTLVQISDTAIRNNSRGVDMDGGAKVSMSRLTVTGNTFGIITNASTVGVTYDVRDSVVANNVVTGIVANPVGAVTVKAVVSNSQLTGNQVGFFGGTAGAGAITKATLTSNLIANNAGDGMSLNGAAASILVSDNTISGNAGTGINNSGGAAVSSTASNSVSQNGTPTSGTITTVGKI